eukprot:TRINITY_DN2151_c0_g4_i1.p1 TRINITY_DN2151_c0_g4~~TRINITY_DN2151_c0_g4_i1.p1  ORF type:complete len:480 (-),score=129.40 TRINITY_DN2151_c0_g4_i1:80-1519(-)
MTNSGFNSRDDDEIPILEDPFVYNEKKWYKELLKIEIIILIATVLIALVSGSPNAFGVFILPALGDYLSNFEISVLNSCGLVGLYFTVFVGWIYDKLGTLKSLFIFYFTVLFGFALYSLLPIPELFVLQCIGYVMVSFGSGGTFITAMGTAGKAYPENPGFAIAIPGAGMSLSVAFLVQVTSLYMSLSDCTDNSCWDDYIIIEWICFMVCVFIGITLIALVNIIKPIYSSVSKKSVNEDDSTTSLIDLEEEESQLDNDNKPIPISQSFVIFKNKFFWVLFLGYFTAIGYGLLVLININTMWNDFTKDKRESWVGNISTAFSFVNAASTLIVGWISDYLVKKNIISRAKIIGIYLIGCGVFFFLLGSLSFIETENEFLQIVFMIMLIMVGIGFGIAFTVFPAIASELWGFENFGLLFGYLQFSSALASIFIPLISPQIYDLTGGFEVLFYFIGALGIIGGALHIFIKPTPLDIKKTNIYL